MAPSQRAPRVESGASTLRRGEVAERLGVSVTSVRRLEERGELHPTVGDGGERLFDPAEVEQVAAARRSEARPEADGPPPAIQGPVGGAGELAARAFALFDAGKLPWQVVVETHEAPDVIATLHGEYLRLGGGGIVLPAQVRSNLERIIGRIDPTQLGVFVELVGAWVRLGRTIVKRPCESCGSKQDPRGLRPWETEILVRWRHAGCAARVGADLGQEIETSGTPCCVCGEVLDLEAEESIYIQVPLRPAGPDATTEIEWWHVRRCNAEDNG